MADGLLGMLGGGQQQAQQGNMLGGLFQSESQARRQGRNRLLGQALQIAQQQDPVRSGFALAGGLLGQGIARSMGRVTPEEARQQKFAGLQQQLMSEGLDPTRDPAGFYNRTSELLYEMGETGPALQAAARARELAPEPQELTNVRDIETEDRGTVTVGTFGNRLVEITPKGLVPFEGDRDIEEEAKFTARNISLPNVGTVIGQVDEQGRVFYKGQEVTDQAQFAPQRVEQGEPGAFGTTQKQEFDIRSARVAAQNYVNTAEDAIALLEESPDVNTFVGRAASVANALEAEGKAIARATGVEFDESILEPSNYSSQFEDLGINNRRLQGIITSGAFQAAAAAGQTGKAVSDKDMQFFIGQFGADASDPQAFAASLKDSVNRTVRNLRNRSKELYGEDLGEDITFMGEPIGFTQAELRERETRLSREDAIKQLPDDATLGKQDPETGAWQVYRDGKIIGEIRPD